MFYQLDPIKITLDPKFRGMCKLPFYGHAYGCPNFGKKQGCPPHNFLEKDILDFNRDLFLIYTRFDLAGFASRIAERHPDWVKHPRMLVNPRQWQPSARKLHRQDISTFRQYYPDMYVDESPESKGVNVSELMKQVGITLSWDWPPKEIANLSCRDLKDSKKVYTYRVSLAGYLIDSHH